MSAKLKLDYPWLRSLAGVVVVAVLVCIAQPAGYSVTISRSVLYFDCNPGEIQEQYLVIRNNGSESSSIRIQLLDWDDTPDGKTILASAGSVDRSCAEWTNYSPDAIDLAPGQEQEVRIRISAPAEAAGTYWAALLVDSPTSQIIQSEGILVRTRFLIKIYQTSLGGKKTGRITRVDAEGLSPLGVSAEFSNTGTILMKDVEITATVQNRSGKILGIFSSDPFSVLPDRTVKAALQSSIYMQLADVYLITAIADFGEDYVVAGKVSLRIKPLSLYPIGESSNPPTDIDGDGLYEDIDGDKRLTKQDVSLFTDRLGDRSIAYNARAFDYNNDGVITLDDVSLLQALLLRIAEPNAN